MPDYLDQLSDFLAQTSFDDLDAETVTHAGLVLADTLGCIAAGSREPEMSALRDRLISSPRGEAIVVGDSRRAMPDAAAFLNASAGTFHELDEGNRYARGHPGIHVIPAALAAISEQSATGAELTTAIVLGYEVAARLGSAMRIRPGGHPHGTWGTVGAAVTLGKLAAYTPQQFRAAINIAATLSILPSGVAVVEGATAALAYPGAGCRQAFLVRDIVAADLTAQRDAPGTIYGKLLSDSFDPAVMTDALGSRWEIARNYFKRFACVRYAHGLLDALERILGDLPAGRLDPRSISAIEARAHMPVSRLTEAAPANSLAARVSIPFALATYVVSGGASVAGFTQSAVDDPHTRELAQRITVVEDPAFTAEMPAKRPAQITIELTDGAVLSERIDHIRGDPEAPLDRQELRAKFDSLAGGTWSSAAADQVWNCSTAIGDAADASDLINAFGT